MKLKWLRREHVKLYVTFSETGSAKLLKLPGFDETNGRRTKRGVATHLSCVNARYSNSRVNRVWRVAQDFLGSLEDRTGTRRRISVALPPAQKNHRIN